jgi:hypothetical protein
VLISSVLSILDKQDVSPREAVGSVTEPFAALLAPGFPAQDRPPSTPEIRHENMELLSRVQSLPPKVRAAMFSVEQRSYDSFLRALEESRKPLGAHALDLFQ